MKKAFIIYLAVLLPLAGICGVIFLPTLIAAAGGTGQWAAAARYAFGPFCHQDPARSLAIGGLPLPVCARCAGIFVGAFLGWALWYFVPARRRDRAVSNLQLILGLGPMVIDGAINTTTLVTSPGWLRFGTGFLFGAMAARAVWPALREALVDPVSYSAAGAQSEGPGPISSRGK